MARIEPPSTELTKPFWDATRNGQLALQWCTDCDRVVHYPREACPGCLGRSLAWRVSSGEGEIYAFSVMYRGASPMTGTNEPYTVAIVSLEGGARLMTNIVNCPIDDVKVGMPVRVCWEVLSDGRKLPLFEPR